MDDEANALRGNAAPAAPGLDSRLWPIPPMVGAEPNPGVITDDWILSQVVFDEDAEAPIPAAVLQIEDGPPLEEAEVPPNQVPSSISPTIPFVALQIEDRAAHHAAHPEPAQSWSLTWDQFDQLLGSGSQATPPDFGRLDFNSGASVSVGNLDFQFLFDADWRSQPSRMGGPVDALPTHEPTQGFPHDGESDPIEDFSPSHVAGSAQREAGKRAIEDWPQIAGLPPVSGSSDVDIIDDRPSPADMDFIPDAVSSHLSGTRDRNADRYNAGPNPSLSSGTRGRDASRYNAGSNPPDRTSDTGRSDAGRETAGPNPSSSSSRSHAGLFAAFNRRQTRKESASDVIDLEEQSSHGTSDGSEQDTPGIGSTPFDLLDIPFHQPPRRGNEDDETIPGILDVIDEAEVTPERRTTSLPPSRVAKVLSPKPLNDDVAQRLDLTQPNPDQAQLRGSSSFDNVSGQTGTDSRATKRSSESPERREAALRLRSNPPAHHDPIDIPIHSAGSGLSSNAPMSEKETDDGINSTPRNRRHGLSTVAPGHGGLPSNQPVNDSLVPAFFQIGTPGCTPDREENRRGDHDADSRPAPSASTSGGHPVASELQRLLLAIHNEIKGCKAEIQGCRTEIRSCRDDINACVGEIKKINNRVDAFEKKVESSFSAVAGTLSKHEAKFRDFHEWIARSEKAMSERFKMYDERSDSIAISAAELREQAESLENAKVQLLRFSEIGALEAEIRRIKDEVEANSRSVIDIEGTISRERTIRGNVETYIQHLVPATDLKQFSDRVSGTLNENSQKQEEFKLQISRIAKCVKDLHDRSLGPNPRDMQEQFMKLVLRVNEINMQIAELREQPHAACGSSNVGAASTAGTGTWEKSGDTDPLTQGRAPRGSPPRDARTVSSARPSPPPPPSGPPPPSPSPPIFGRDPSRTRAIARAAGAAPDNRARCAHEEPGHPQHREPRYPCRSCGKSVCENCFDHDCNSCFKCSDQFPRCRACRGRGGRHGLVRCLICKDEYCDQHIASPDDVRRFGSSVRPICLGCLRADPDGKTKHRGPSAGPGGADCVPDHEQRDGTAPDPGSRPSRGDPSHRSPEPHQGNSGFCSHAGAAGPMPPRAMSSPVVGRAVPRGTTNTYPGCSPTGGIFTGQVEHGTSQGIIRGRYGPDTAVTNQQNSQPHHGVQDNPGGSNGFSLPPGLGKGVHGASGVGGIGAPDLRRSSAEERVCPRCNINVKTSIPGTPPCFQTCSLCRTSLCAACCPPSSGSCSLCAISIGRDGVLPPHIFGQATRPPLTSLPSEANKCANIELEKEPAPHELRDWIISTREIVSNAFSYDSPYAMSWVMSVENASAIEELDEECLYPILDNRFNAALRKCITSKPIVAKISRLTEEAQVKRGTRLKSRQILFCLIEYLRPDEVGSQSIRTNELLRLSLGRAAGSGEPQLEKFLDKWEGLLGGITAPIDHHVLQHVFFEQVRHSPCLMPDVQHWDRNPDVQNYDWIMRAARNAVSRWRTRYNVSEIKERMYSRSPHADRNPNAAAPGVRRPSPFGDTRKTGDARSSDRDRGKTRSGDPRRNSRERPSPGRDRRHEHPATPGVCHDWQKGQCRRGSECRFAHHEEKPNSPRDNDGPIYPGYCREWLNAGKCTRPKCTYKHEKPPPDLAPLPRKPGAPATEQGGDSSSPYPDGRIDSPAPGVDEGF